jgi:hypothetical protein
LYSICRDLPGPHRATRLGLGVFLKTLQYRSDLGCPLSMSATTVAYKGDAFLEELAQSLGLPVIADCERLRHFMERGSYKSNEEVMLRRLYRARLTGHGCPRSDGICEGQSRSSRLGRQQVMPAITVTPHMRPSGREPLRWRSWSAHWVEDVMNVKLKVCAAVDVNVLDLIRLQNRFMRLHADGAICYRRGRIPVPPAGPVSVDCSPSGGR